MKSPTGCRPDQLIGPWCIELRRFGQMHAIASKIDLVALGEAKYFAKHRKRADDPMSPIEPQDGPDDDGDDDEEAVPLYVVDRGVAQISLTGPLTKYMTSFQMLFGGTSTLMAIRALRLADADPNVFAIMLKLDSPGGTVSGTSDLGECIADLSKPCFAYASDLCASAAYWAASQCDRIMCNTTAEVGCIGVLLVIDDASVAYEKAGYKVHVVTSDAPGGDTMKGAGTDGAPVTEEQLAYFKSLNNDINALFVAAIAKGRNMSTDQVRLLADGRIHVGTNAVDIGLVDRVCSYDDAMKQLRERAFFGASSN